MRGKLIIKNTDANDVWSEGLGIDQKRVKELDAIISSYVDAVFELMNKNDLENYSSNVLETLEFLNKKWKPTTPEEFILLGHGITNLQKGINARAMDVRKEQVDRIMTEKMKSLLDES